MRLMSSKVLQHHTEVLPFVQTLGNNEAISARFVLLKRQRVSLGYVPDVHPWSAVSKWRDEVK